MAAAGYPDNEIVGAYDHSETEGVDEACSGLREIDENPKHGKI